MYLRMLVPLDGSAFAAQALPFARLLAKAFGAQIELIQVMPPFVKLLQAVPGRSDDTDGLGGGAPGQFDPDRLHERHERLQQTALLQLEDWAQPLRAVGVNVKTSVKEGNAAEEIAREADQVEGTLITMSTHGRSGFARWRLGSVTDKTIHLTAAPALVVRCREGEPLPSDIAVRRILLPLDGSSLAEQAVPHAVALAKALEVPVDVLQAVSARRPVGASFGGAGIAGAPEMSPMEAGRADMQANAYLDGMVELLRMQGVRQVDPSPVEGDAAKAILGAAEDTDGALVVMSTHGRSGLNRLLRGSIADKVVRESGRPVLLVRPQ